MDEMHETTSNQNGSRDPSNPGGRHRQHRVDHDQRVLRRVPRTGLEPNSRNAPPRESANTWKLPEVIPTPSRSQASPGGNSNGGDIEMGRAASDDTVEPCVFIGDEKSGPLFAESACPDTRQDTGIGAKRDTGASVKDKATKALVKYYNLALSPDVYREIEAIADAEGTSVVHLIRQFIKLGLIAFSVQKDPDSRLIIREKDRERELVIL